MNNTCIFTIVSRNYLHYARTLLNSIKEKNENIDFYIGLCDSPEGVDLPEKEFTILPLKDINLPDWDNFVFRYTILELNTAIKPFVISDMLEKGYEKVFYFDPDIYVYRSLNQMLDILDNCDILLTPHLTGFLDDEKMPDELTIMRSGVYNLGYIGLRNCDNTKSFINWWKDKLTYECVVDVEAGLFVDQKWVDLVPSIFNNVHIERNNGWNVAYWNLRHRIVEQQDDDITVNGDPLTFFHYSGFNVDAKTLSKHQNRFSKKSAGSTVQKLCDDYGKKLLSHDVKIYEKIPYYFGSLPGDIAIPDMGRYIFREEIESRGKPEQNIYSKNGVKWIISKLNLPAKITDQSIPWITVLAKRLYDAREDLQFAFPDLSGIDGVRYGEWFVGSAGSQANMGVQFTNPVADALAELRANQTEVSTNSNADPEGAGDESDKSTTKSEPKPSGKSFAKIIYDYAWQHRHIGRFVVPQSYRKKLHAFLLGRVYPKVAGKSKQEINIAQESTEISNSESSLGINIVGYLNAESGIGESVRSTVKALNTTTLSKSLVDFRVGNVSRMDEEVEAKISNEFNYPINLFHINADQIPVVHEHLGREGFEGRYNIGYWAWELGDFPDEWVSSLDYLDEIWVPSTFCQKAISQKSTKPVLVFPHAVEVSANVDNEVLPSGLDPDAYKFLFMFDALSIPERKNPFALLNAFKKAKSKSTNNIQLIVKVSNLDKAQEFKQQFSSICDGDESILIIEGYLTRTQINVLHQSVDCFVSLHRSEGFGLGMAESMAFGKPVIATDWSGNTDFIDSHSALPIPYSLVELETDLGPYQQGQKWAEPSIEAAAEKMAWLAANPEKGNLIGVKAKQSINNYCSPEVIGETMANRIKTLFEHSC